MAGREAYLAARHLVEGLMAGGVRMFFTSPGFRNSPILAVLADRSGISVVSHVDERGSAFAALGASKDSGAPVAVLCTSGTAAGNFLPAVMEAFHSRTPLVVVTADRPPELVGVGANQATWQPGIFGRFAETNDLFVAESAESAAEWGMRARRSAELAALKRRPVHLNVRFREPFTYTAADKAAAAAEEPDVFRKEPAAPHVKARAAEEAPERVRLDFSRAVVLLGEGLRESDRLAAARFCEEKNVPLLANLHAWKSAGSSTGEAFPGYSVILRADLFLRSLAEKKTLRADTVIRLGTPLVGRNYSSLWRAAARRIAVDEEGRDPDLCETVVWPGSAQDFFSTQKEAGAADPEWIRSWRAAESRAETIVDRKTQEERALTEWHVWRDMSWLPDGADLFIGNSMPIRDYLWVGKNQSRGRVFTNRGLSGIDGLLSTAIGAGAASGRKMVAVLGDLSAIHDVTALALGRNLNADVVLVVLNNGGGEIFRVVESAEYPVDEKVFTTPNRVDFCLLARSFGWNSVVAESLEELREAVSGSQAPLLVEVKVDKNRNTAIRREVWERLSES